MVLVVEEIDVHDDAAMAEFHGPVHASDREDWPEDPGWSAHELAVMARNTTNNDHVLAVARDIDGVVGSLWIRMPLRENLHVAEMHLTVRPDRLGRGIGRAMLDYAEDVVRRNGRTTIQVEVEEPTDRAGADSRRARFARAAGYVPGLSEARRVLRLPVAKHHLDDLEAAARPFSDGYEIVTWSGHTPVSYEQGRIALGRNISADAPMGTLEAEEENWDVDRLHDHDRVTEDMDRDAYTAGAVDQDGRLVAFTEIQVPRQNRVVGYQQDTVVLPAHRGHRLGLLVKIANTRVIQEKSPDTKRTLTWNAPNNDPMIRVNDALGCEVAGLGTVWQRVLSEGSAPSI